MENLNEIEPEVPISGPGKALQRARNDLGLTVDDVAAQLHLAPRQIVAIESDDYPNLPQATYVRGYLRSYASLVGLSSDSVLQLYARATTSASAKTQKPVRLAPVDAEEREQATGHQVWWMTAGIALVVVALAYAWWEGREEPAPATPVAQQTTAPAAPVGASVPLPPELRAREARPAGGAVALPRAPVAPTGAPGPDTVRAPAAPNTASAAVNPPTQGLPNQTPEPSAGQVPAEPTNVAADAQVAPEQPATPLPDVKPARLVLQVDADSWAEVRDAREVRLIYRTVAAGQGVTLKGIPPFQVFLGNADGVKVMVDGRAFDFSRYKRGVTARFAVDVSEPESR